MNRNIWQVFIYEVRRNAVRKGFLFTTFGVPLIGFLILTGVRLFSDSPEELAAELEFDIQNVGSSGYVDLSGQFPEPGPFVETFMVRFDTEAEAQVALDAGAIELYYILDPDYIETGAVTLVIPQFSINLIVNARGPFEALLYGQWAEDVEVETLLRLREPSHVEIIEFTDAEADGTTKDEDADFIVAYVFTIIFMLAIFGTNGYLMQSVIEEKESKLIEILLSSVRPGQLLAGKIFAMGTIGLFQVIVYVTAAVLLSNMAANTSELADMFTGNINVPLERLPLLFIYFVLGYLFFAAGFGAVGAISSSMSEGPNIAMIFTLPAVAPLYFIILFVNNPNATLPVVLSLLPVTGPIAMVMRTALTSVPLIQIILSISLQILAVWGMFWIAGRMFRIQTLLSGQVPRLRDIPALLRG